MTAVLIACGGTGGHLSPGIAIAEVLEQRNCQPVLLISRKQVDSALIRKYPHLPFHKAPGRAFAGGLLGRITALADVVKGFIFSCRLIHRYRPGLVLLFGGFLSLGLGLAARLCGIPVALHEANCRPGRAVRLLKFLARRVYLPDGVDLGVTPDRVRYFGYPVRNEIQPIPKAEARKRLGLEVSGKLLVVIGGSQGAESLNRWVQEHFENLADAGVSTYCLTGLGKEREDRVIRRSADGDSMTADFVPFSDNMGAVLSAADLVVSRAGAGAIAEIIRCSVPAILVPYPHAADDHQLANALAHEQLGAGIILRQEDLQELIDQVLLLLSDTCMLAGYKEKMQSLRESDAAGQTADDILFLSGSGIEGGKSR